MSETTAFTFRIFALGGDPDGLRLLDRTNWNGNAS